MANKIINHINEDVLQVLLERNPDLLSLCGKENPLLKWILINREVGIPLGENDTNKWYLDHLFIDQNAVPTLVEVKCSYNNQIRREIIGQMFDYVANAVNYWSLDSIKTEYTANCFRTGDDPTAKILKLLGKSGNNIEICDVFWNKVFENLKKSRIRLVFVADVIPPDLRRLIEFLSDELKRIDVRAINLYDYLSEHSDKISTIIQELKGKRTYRLKPDYNLLYKIAEKQAGYFTTAQAQRVGFSCERLSNTVKSGKFLRITQGVYRLVQFPGSSHEDLYIAWLKIGPNSAISHESALAFYDLSDVLPGEVHVIMSRTASRRRKNIRLHTNQIAPDEITKRDGLAITTVARTIADVANHGMAEEQVQQAIREALQRGLVSREELLTQANRRGGRAKKIILDAIQEGR